MLVLRTWAQIWVSSDLLILRHMVFVFVRWTLFLEICKPIKQLLSLLFVGSWWHYFHSWPPCILYYLFNIPLHVGWCPRLWLFWFPLPPFPLNILLFMFPCNLLKWLLPCIFPFQFPSHYFCLFSITSQYSNVTRGYGTSF